MTPGNIKGTFRCEGYLYCQYINEDNQDAMPNNFLLSLKKCC